jgi:hypothetical protein
MPDSNQRLQWTAVDFDGFNIPESTQQFLMTRGLPHRLGESTIEFGIFSSPDRFVIGQDYEFAIFVLDDGTVWEESDSNDGDPRFINSSVSLLDEFIAASENFDAAAVEKPDIAINALEQRLRGLDPAAFAQSNLLWPLLLSDMRAILT